jgi:membrane protein DedA with SNARE-associated domain
MFNQFTHLVADASGWAYAVAFVFAFLDALLPVVPSETAVITAGVVSATGHLSLPLAIVAAACGAFAGDNAAYFIGYRFGPYARDRFFRGEKGRKTIRWTERQLAVRGGELILVARFIPGGRIAVTLSAGAARYPWPRFAVFDASAGITWASYAALLGFFGGKAFAHTPWAGLLLALAIAFAVTGALELGRAYARRRRKAQHPDVGSPSLGQDSPDRPAAVPAPGSGTGTGTGITRPEGRVPPDDGRLRVVRPNPTQ